MGRHDQERIEIIAQIRQCPSEAVSEAREEFGLADPWWPPTASGCLRLLELTRKAANRRMLLRKRAWREE